MSTNLYQASSNWATRPADQRFSSLQELHAAACRFQARAVERLVKWSNLSFATDGQEITMAGPAGVPARLTHWAFGQLAQRAGAPGNFLRALPAPLAVDCLKHTLSPRIDLGESANLLLSRSNGDDSVTVHAMLTDRYQRIWDSDVTARLLTLGERGWQVPPARPAFPDQPGSRRATSEDVLLNSQHAGLGIKVGDWIAPAGLYASDHDIFAFMVREDRVIEAGEGRALNRGFFVWNSEVGAASYGMLTFLYDKTCGNHIVWGAKNVREIRVRHVGAAKDRVAGFMARVTAFADSSASDDAARITKARNHYLGQDKEKVLDTLLGLRIPGLSQGIVAKAYGTAEEHEPDGEGNPRTVWGIVNGLTRVSQESSHTDERVALDRAAGKVMELVF